MPLREHGSPNDSQDIRMDHQMKLRTRHKPSHCPWCGSRKIAFMLSGMPVFFPDLEQALDDGGGLVVGGRNNGEGPTWQCTECYAQFFRDRPEPR